MTLPAHIAAHLEEARKAQTKWMHDLWTELAEDEMDALTPRVRIPLGIDLAIDETCADALICELFAPKVAKERMN